ncbi:MAG: HEAT repeat domain-containing protein [Gemmatimonadales bacterium]|jgi:hypothetical protein
MRIRVYGIRFAVGAALLALAPPASGQSIAERVARLNEGKVRLSFATRPGVCGDGRANISFDGGRGRHVRHGRSEDWDWECEGGPARVILRVHEGDVTGVDAYVGGYWRPASSSTVDLGTVSAPQAARYFISLARRPGRVADDAIFPAMLADSATVWPDLLEIARDGTLAENARKSAVFWLSQEAAAAAGEGLGEIAFDDSEDWDIRQTAIFALSQRPSDEGVPLLIRLARTSENPRVVKQALFWLGQSEDPRALALFEELLTGR